MTKSAKLIARFVLDDKGNPKLIEQDNQKHYLIDLSVENAPEDTYAVNYRLDESYYDPLRESHLPSAGFVERLTSYGDYTVQASIRTKSRVEPISAELSEALARGHRDDKSPTIDEALEDIKKY